VRTIVETLVETTKEMERNNQALEARLKASTIETTQLQQHLEAVRNESRTDPLTTSTVRWSGPSPMRARPISTCPC